MISPAWIVMAFTGLQALQSAAPGQVVCSVYVDREDAAFVLTTLHDPSGRQLDEEIMWNRARRPDAPPGDLVAQAREELVAAQRRLADPSTPPERQGDAGSASCQVQTETTENIRSVPMSVLLFLESLKDSEGSHEAHQ